MISRLNGEKDDEGAALFRAVRLERVFPFADLELRWPDRPSDVEIAGGVGKHVQHVQLLAGRRDVDFRDALLLFDGRELRAGRGGAVWVVGDDTCG